MKVLKIVIISKLIKWKETCYFFFIEVHVPRQRELAVMLGESNLPLFL
jgi:hypothetical protein